MNHEYAYEVATNSGMGRRIWIARDIEAQAPLTALPFDPDQQDGKKIQDFGRNWCTLLRPSFLPVIFAYFSTDVALVVFWSATVMRAMKQDLVLGAALCLSALADITARPGKEIIAKLSQLRTKTFKVMRDANPTDIFEVWMKGIVTEQDIVREGRYRSLYLSNRELEHYKNTTPLLPYDESLNFWLMHSFPTQFNVKAPDWNEIETKPVDNPIYESVPNAKEDPIYGNLDYHAITEDDDNTFMLQCLEISLYTSLQARLIREEVKLNLEAKKAAENAEDMEEVLDTMTHTHISDARKVKRKGVISNYFSPKTAKNDFFEGMKKRDPKRNHGT